VIVRWPRGEGGRRSGPDLPSGLGSCCWRMGIGTNEIARRTAVSKPTVILRKKRYAAEGIGGLEDRMKPDKPANHRRCW
jgi:hypothetical protein